MNNKDNNNNNNSNSNHLVKRMKEDKELCRKTEDLLKMLSPRHKELTKELAIQVRALKETQEYFKIDANNCHERDEPDADQLCVVNQSNFLYDQVCSIKEINIKLKMKLRGHIPLLEIIKCFQHLRRNKQKLILLKELIYGNEFDFLKNFSFLSPSKETSNATVSLRILGCEHIPRSFTLKSIMAGLPSIVKRPLNSCTSSLDKGHNFRAKVKCDLLIAGKVILSTIAREASPHCWNATFTYKHNPGHPLEIQVIWIAPYQQLSSVIKQQAAHYEPLNIVLGGLAYVSLDEDRDAGFTNRTISLYPEGKLFLETQIKSSVTKSNTEYMTLSRRSVVTTMSPRNVPISPQSTLRPQQPKPRPQSSPRSQSSTEPPKPSLRSQPLQTQPQSSPKPQPRKQPSPQPPRPYLRSQPPQPQPQPQPRPQPRPQPPPQSPSSSPSTPLPGYRIRSLLGTGHFGKIMLCQKMSDRKYYAVKIIKKQRVIESNEFEQVETEKTVLELVKSKNHPLMVHLSSCIQDACHVMFVLEFIQAGDLITLIDSLETFSEAQALFYVSSVVLCLEFLHANNVMYRDVKMENLLLDRRGYIKLVDFGLCKLNMAKDGCTHTLCGTIDYMAPEIFSDHGYTRVVDWWSVGVLLYYMLVGEVPFSGDTESESVDAILTKPVTTPSSLDAITSSFIISLLNRNPKSRLGSRNGAVEVKIHPYFARTDFDRIFSRSVVAPYIPHLRNERDLSYFDPQFTTEKPSLSFTEVDLNDYPDAKLFFKNFCD